MEKTLNIVIYMPNYAGNFIRFILSLDDITYPVHKWHKGPDVIGPRKQLYSYKNLLHKHGNWDKFEQTFISPARDPFPLFLGQDQYKMMTLQYHPGSRKEGKGFYPYFEETYQDVLKTLKVNHMQVYLSEKYSTMPGFFDDQVSNNSLSRSPLRLSNWATHARQYEEYRKKHNPYQINLDCFLEGEDLFAAEYEKMCKHVDVPIHMDDALELYKDWYKARRLKEYMETLT